jgi:eukaryotic-like serine/threonine-protein kinase
MTDPVATLREGLRDRYALERELGRGGMATVWLAQDLRHDRPVALKLLHPELAATLGPERFQREIRLAARLQHPHILTVLDSGETGGRLWFTMPYVEGESLRDRLRRERQLPVDAALRIAVEAARGLEYAHQHGVAHRDIKPENILLTRDGSTLVADFGIARALGGDDGLTQTGLAIGTPAYMSPEQAAGDKSLDARTDQYSLAAVLYEMLSGEAPWTGATAQAIAAKRLTEPAPSVRAVRPNVPGQVDEAIRKALAPVAADRFDTMAELVHALQTTPTRATPLATAVTTARDVSPATTAPPAPLRPRSRVPIAALALVLGLLIGVGALFAWRRSHPDDAGTAGGAKRVAVLPFENLGGPDDEYFADGVTDEIRGKLASLSSLQVTASRSAAEYKKSTKDLATIARELGVDYLLVGKVRWEKGAGGEGSRVRVSPELIRIASGSTEWQEPFDARITDVFQVQADIAGRVAQALDVALGSNERETLAERPTADVAAYDAYLKGWEAMRAGTATEPASLRRAALYFEQAIALDSGFAIAWAQRGLAYSLLYSNSTPDTATARAALVSAQRARQLAPDRPESYVAMAEYYRNVTNNLRAALEQATLGQRIAPTDVNLLVAAALSQQGLGQWDEATRLFARAQALDPRSFPTAFRLSRGLLFLRRYDEAEAAGRRALALAETDPSVNETLTMIRVARGDLPGAREVLTRATRQIEAPVMVAYAATYYDLFWVLDDAQRALLFRLGPGYFDGDRGAWGLALASAHALAGHAALARAYADSASMSFEEQLKGTPNDAQLHVLWGTALAYLGRKDQAIREGRRAVELMPISANGFTGPYLRHQLARIYILTGEPERAIDELEPLLRIPYLLSRGWLRIDPTFDPLRSNPRFQRLLEGTT